ncbi:MAG: nucleotidyl transferase AbiEii/AbiGii toxin family protein [Myxococcota bacterium]
MKEHLHRLTEQAGDPLMRLSVAREYLQARMLESIQDTGTFNRWAFVGGTALRFLFSIPRFSEDLDFSLIRAGEEAGFRRPLEEMRRVLSLEGYRIEIRVKERRTVLAAWIRFPGLPYELGLSGRAAQVLSIKLEVDTKPPAGARIETSIVRRHVTLNLCHHDRPSLFAGKLHAVLSRPWAKGRDLFDLAWYLASPSRPEPNLTLLNAALMQTGWSGPEITSSSWRAEIRKRLEKIDWQRARADVGPFLERQRDLALVSAEALEGLLAAE